MSWLTPDWPAPKTVKAIVTTREQGGSTGPYAAFNMALHVGDDPKVVEANRGTLSQLGCTPAWLNQVHSVDVVPADTQKVLTADANFTREQKIACTVMTADCLPALFCDRAGTVVAAAHAGWRGLAGGILEKTASAMGVEPSDILVWLGPAIGPHAFEVGPEVREAFLAVRPESERAFRPSAKAGHFYADLYQLARIHLASVGVTAVYGGGFCTFTDERFYSYRRAHPTGRMASLIWLD